MNPHVTHRHAPAGHDQRVARGGGDEDARERRIRRPFEGDPDLAGSGDLDVSEDAALPGETHCW